MLFPKPFLVLFLTNFDKKIGMTLRELRRLVRQGEGQQLEFKKKTIYPFKILKEIVAMANAQGGILLIGVADNGNIAGLKHPEDDEYVMMEYIAKYCRPAVQYELEKVVITAERAVLVFHIQESKHKPVFRLYDLKKKIGKAYLRVADKSLQTSREVRKILKFSGKETSPYQGFSYGENERKLVQYLEKNTRITTERFAELADIPKKEAAELLVRLTLCNLIALQPEEHGDFFVMKE